jgi:putative nucleotidyltransferase with HDIG domain
MTPLSPIPPSSPIREAILADIRKFPAMPAMCQELLTHLHDPDIDFKKLADKVQYDPGLTANLLKVANSAMFGTGRRVGSLQAAFVRLGVKQLFQVLVASGMSKVLTRALDGYALEKSELLTHSVWVAVAAEELAAQTGNHPPDLLFTAGLLHDLGKVALSPHIVPVRAEIERVSREQKLFFEQAEGLVLGIDHAEAGARILDGWKFPRELVNSIRWHHQPGEAKQFRLGAFMLHLADVLGYSEGFGTGMDGLRYTISMEAVATLKLRSSMLERVASRTLDKMQELQGMLG